MNNFSTRILGQFLFIAGESLDELDMQINQKLVKNWFRNYQFFNPFLCQFWSSFSQNSDQFFNIFSLIFSSFLVIFRPIFGQFNANDANKWFGKCKQSGHCLTNENATGNLNLLLLVQRSNSMNLIQFEIETLILADLGASIHKWINWIRINQTLEMKLVTEKWWLNYFSTWQPQFPNTFRLIVHQFYSQFFGWFLTVFQFISDHFLVNNSPIYSQFLVDFLINFR